MNRKVAAAVLARCGCSEVDVAAGGREAIAAVQSAAPPYDLVLMDLQMPEVDGQRAVREIRQWEAAQGGGAPRVAVVALTACENHRAECLQNGFDGFLLKPITPVRAPASSHRFAGCSAGRVCLSRRVLWFRLLAPFLCVPTYIAQIKSCVVACVDLRKGCLGETG